MSLVRYYAAATLDGYIAAADDSIEWLTGYEGSFEGADSDASQAGYEAFYEGIGALVMGSVDVRVGPRARRRLALHRETGVGIEPRELDRPEGEERRRPDRQRRTSPTWSTRCSARPGIGTSGSSVAGRWRRSSPITGCSTGWR